MAPGPPWQPPFHLATKVSLSRSTSSGVAVVSVPDVWSAQTGPAPSPKSQAAAGVKAAARRHVVHDEIHLIEADRCHDATVPLSVTRVSAPGSAPEARHRRALDPEGRRRRPPKPPPPKPPPPQAADAAAEGVVSVFDEGTGSA